VALREAAVVHRDVDGVLSLVDEVDPHEGTATVTGGLLIDTLIGPRRRRGRGRR
jgi:hypothetical protein